MFLNLLYEFQLHPTPAPSPFRAAPTPNPTPSSLKTSPITVTFSAGQGLGINFADPEILFHSPTVDLAVNVCHAPHKISEKGLQHTKTDNKL